jgi:hypothetical protein
MFEIYTVHMLLYIYIYIYVYITVFMCFIISTNMYNSWQSIRKSSHSCNQQIMNRTFNFTWQEQGLIPQNSIIKVANQFCERFVLCADWATLSHCISWYCCPLLSPHLTFNAKKPFHWYRQYFAVLPSWILKGQ